MRLNQLKEKLAKHPTASLRFILPNGKAIPAHTHVTEVGRVDKTFIDCGGTVRSESVCRLQTWFSDDVAHRLTGGKLLKILTKADPLLGAEDLEVDVEHEVNFVSQFPLDSVAVSKGEVILQLAARHTDCLARAECKPPATWRFNLITQGLKSKQPESGCCARKRQ
jgi:hypothetical protein